MDERNGIAGERYVLALDIGGTFIKSGLIGNSGDVVEIRPVTVDSNGAMETIIHSFSSAVEAGVHKAREVSGLAEIDGIGIAMPGPFDYNRGISLMTHKFASIYGLDLSAELHKRLPETASVPVRFCHDANAFVIGETWRGAGEGFSHVIGVTLGTGIGVAASVEGEVLVDALGSPADEVSLWNKPYQGGIVEDSVSSRALLARYRACRPAYDASNGVKGIAEAAFRGDAEARAVFDQFGEDLGNVLMPLAQQLAAQIIIFGGQIAKSFDLFEMSLKAVLQKMKCPPLVCVGKLGGTAQLYGAVSWWRKNDP
ncbi:MAG: ROK family protein [Phycisphaerae bacterium]|jgi:glucokinase|nr:ROK family protein [Phycisphaerae bacterium]